MKEIITYGLLIFWLFIGAFNYFVGVHRENEDYCVCGFFICLLASFVTIISLNL